MGVLKKVKKVKEPQSGAKNDEVSELKNQLARALADYDNLRRRTEEEKEDWVKIASIRTTGRLLPILDMLTSAQTHLNDPGLAIVLGEFRKVIEEEGLTEIKIEKELTDFDSELMEAVEVVDTEDENHKNKIAEVLVSGWKLKDGEDEKGFVIRPAKVKVYASSK